MSTHLKGISRQSPFPLRLPPSLRMRLELQAGRGNRSLNAHINLLLERNVSEYPILTTTDVVEEQFSREPYGLRLPEALKACLQNSANESGRSLNTELILRLQLAESVAGESGSIERAAEALPYPPQVVVAWLRLSRAVDAMLSASALDMTKAAVELRSAKAAFDQVTSIESPVSTPETE